MENTDLAFIGLMILAGSLLLGLLPILYFQIRALVKGEKAPPFIFYETENYADCLKSLEKHYGQGEDVR